jgi:uncharacterized integral membrane protein
MNDEVSEKTERRIRTRQTLRVLILLILAAVLVVWALANTDDVEVDWLFDTSTVPLVIVIAVSAVVGFVLGLLAGQRRRS